MKVTLLSAAIILVACAAHAKNPEILDLAIKARHCIIDNAAVLAKRSKLKTPIIVKAATDACEKEIDTLAKSMWDQAIGDSAAPMPTTFRQSLTDGFNKSVGFVVDEYRENKKSRK